MPDLPEIDPTNVKDDNVKVPVERADAMVTTE
jgi:hypothetical protein